MGGVAQEEMSKTPNAQLPTSNVQLCGDASTSNIKNRTSNILGRIVGLVVGGVFIVAALTKIFDLDHVIANLRHLRLSEFIVDFQKISFSNPTGFANDIDNYKILPWPISVALAFYLPWLEIFCGFALAVRFLYRGALSLLTALILIFTLATIAAKVRGLDITCGCFGHASQNWSLHAHLATNLAILAALVVLLVSNRSARAL
jgi:putative oxidoreductase